MRLAAEITTVERPPQYLVYRERAPRDEVFILGSGVVRCFKTLPDGRRQITRFFFTGDVFGLIADEGRQVSSAQTVTRATICSFPRSVLDQFPKLHAHLLHRSWSDLARAEDQMLLLGRRTAQERIAHFLLMLAEHAAEPEQRAAIVPVPMSRTDIADYLGLTTETVSRALSQLKRDGVIRLLQRSRIALQNRDALAAMVAGSRPPAQHVASLSA
jgi:CRP/FNR family transcriptional regulator